MKQQSLEAYHNIISGKKIPLKKTVLSFIKNCPEATQEKISVTLGESYRKRVAELLKEGAIIEVGFSMSNIGTRRAIYKVAEAPQLSLPLRAPALRLRQKLSIATEALNIISSSNCYEIQSLRKIAEIALKNIAPVIHIAPRIK